MSWVSKQIAIENRPVNTRKSTLSVIEHRRRPALLCLSHLRWNFVYQRPQHLLTRLSRDYRVLFFEEPVPTTENPFLDIRTEDNEMQILVPHLPDSLQGADRDRELRSMLDQHLANEGITYPALWYYTPMALTFTDHLSSPLIVYDCMDELSAFMGAPPELIARERSLLARADLVFTGGRSLYEAKRTLHPNVHAFPSSVDVAHFSQGRTIEEDPADQASIPHPRIGFFGVIDERLDCELVGRLAEARPDWNIVMLGPVVKIDPATLPQAKNIHWLGPKQYRELPAYLSGWDVAFMPFALNESTRFISPTKTPEFLAGGCPVVSTAITDVVRTYGESSAVRIGGSPESFEQGIVEMLALRETPKALLAEADRLLDGNSWDRTTDSMQSLMKKAWRTRSSDRTPRSSAARRSGFDYLIVGAGFAGSVVAERLAAASNKRVLLIDRRPHIGGNAYDCYDDAGILIHRYGPHIFHTNSPRIADYLSRFTKWRPYEHRVLARVDDKLVPMPINLTTLNQLYGLDLDEAGAEAFLQERAVKDREIKSSEDVVLARVGHELYEKFFRGYTLKQWGVGPWELDKSVTSRVPIRTNTDDRYFNDRIQQMPLHGYTRMFENMLDHPNIKVMLNTDFREIRREIRYDRLIFTGPVDEYFGHCYGKLPYRSLRFEHETVDMERFQPVSVVNEPSESVPYTRTTEYKLLTGQTHSKTSLSREFPTSEGDPYYPIPCAQNDELYRRYRERAEAEANVFFVGRLATYRYYNMDQIVGQALALHARLCELDQADVTTPARVSA